MKMTKCEEATEKVKARNIQSELWSLRLTFTSGTAALIIRRLVKATFRDAGREAAKAKALAAGTIRIIVCF